MSRQQESPPPAAMPPAHVDARAHAHAVEMVISNLLRIGVASSLLVVVSGTIVSFVHHPEFLSQPSALQRQTMPGAEFPHSIEAVWQGLHEDSGQAIVVLGLLLLIATPVLRVAVSIVAFAIEHDRRYVLITSIVLALLILSFFLGKAKG